jgi:hypothetical protein
MVPLRPRPGPLMMSHVIGGGLKLFRVDATDITNDTITALGPDGNPTNHEPDLRHHHSTTTATSSSARAATGRGTGSSRDDLTAHPFPTGAFLAGHTYSVRHWGPGAG